MKLVHPKSWYAKNSEIEGNSEIGAGIPPGTHTQANNSARFSSLATVGTVHVHARRAVKGTLARGFARHTDKVCRHA
jgi:hypothetical protein